MRQVDNCTTKTSFTFDCKEILAVSVVPWERVCLTPIAACTNITGKTVEVKTDRSGCKVFAILRI